MKQNTFLSRFVFWVAVLGLVTWSCQTGGSDQEVSNMREMEQEMAPKRAFSGEEAPAAQGDNALPVEEVRKKIIRDGRMGIKTNDLEAAKTRVDTLVLGNGGYYSNESFHNSDYESAWTLNIRIPAAAFDRFISELESGEGEILFKEIGARDVTDQFIDLETRLANKREYLERYRELVKKATSVKEVLEIEEKIRLLEEEIESVTGRLKYLGDQVDFSTLNLTLTRHKGFKYSPDRPGDFGERLKHSLSKGWHAFVDFLLFLIRLWPFWILAIPAVYFWRKYLRTHGKNRT
ncbi:MAG TPA: DUF4349 domain-containing protein [Prolixibacteraceae bacterium]|nr:DUF4349 domain-containing protein [Prolixibacteraceae bacterium]